LLQRHPGDARSFWAGFAPHTDENKRCLWRAGLLYAPNTMSILAEGSNRKDALESLNALPRLNGPRFLRAGTE